MTQTADLILYEDTERATDELLAEIARDGLTILRAYQLRDRARMLLADPSLDFRNGDTLVIATLLAVADGEMAEARQYVDAMTSRNTAWRYGICAQAESRIFGYLDARGARPKE